jgi:lysophospholipase L1-like esterase
LKEEIRARGFPVLDAAPLLRDAVRREMVFFPGDTHMTPAGNRVVAEALAAWSRPSE